MSEIQNDSAGGAAGGVVALPGPEPDWEPAFRYQGGKRNPAQQYTMWDQAARPYREVAFLRLDLEQIAHRLRLHVERGIEYQLGDIEVAFFTLEYVSFVVRRYLGDHGVIVGLLREATVDPLDALDLLLRVLGTDRSAVESFCNPGTATG